MGLQEISGHPLRLVSYRKASFGTIFSDKNQEVGIHGSPNETVDVNMSEIAKL